MSDYYSIRICQYALCKTAFLIESLQRNDIFQPRCHDVARDLDDGYLWLLKNGKCFRMVVYNNSIHLNREVKIRSSEQFKCSGIIDME